MRHEWLDQERPEDTVDGLHPLDLASTCRDPLFGLRPGLVESEKTALASSLDQLVRLCDELCTALQQPRIGDLGLAQDALDVGAFGEIYRGEPGGRIVGC